LTGIIIDTCGWVAIVDARINIDLSLESQIGPVEIKITNSILNELKILENQNGSGLLLELLEERAEIINSERDYTHTDDEILELAISQSLPVLTVDKTLKSRLHAANAAVIEVTSSKGLRLIE
jgi:rRNA-processing protein FCF1